MTDSFLSTRLVVIHENTRIDIVVASDQALGNLIPRMLDLVGKSSANSKKYDLVLPAGSMLKLTDSCTENKLSEGAEIYLTEQEETPAPPVVSNVTDVIARARDDLPSVWNSKTKFIVSAISIGVLTLVAGLHAPQVIPSRTLQAICFSSLTVLLWIIGFGVARSHKNCPVIALSSICIGLAWPTSLAITYCFTTQTGNQALFSTGCMAVLLIWITLGFITGIGQKHNPALAALCIAGVSALLSVILTFCDIPRAQTAAMTGTLMVIILGMLPAWVVSVSGLTLLDDSVQSGKHADTIQVSTSVANAYQSLSWCITGIAAMATASSLLLAETKKPWSVALSVIIVVVLISRARIMPTGFQVAVYWFAALLGCLGLLFILEPLAQIITTVIAVILMLIFVVVKMPVHLQIRIRGICDVIERIAIFAAVPVLLGVFGVYVSLIEAIK